MRFTKRPNTKGRRVMAETEIADEAAELLFEVEEVAELISNVTGEDVEVTTDGDTAEFAVGDEVFTVEAEGTEEVLESSRIRKSAKRVSASARAKRPMGRTVRKIRK